MSTKIWGNNSRVGLPMLNGVRSYALQTGTPVVSNKTYFDVMNESALPTIPGRWNPTITPTWRPLMHVSERIAAGQSAIISGSITMRVTALDSATGSTAIVRLRLSRWRPANGDIDLILEMSQAFPTVTNTVVVFTGTPAVPIPVAEGDRFILEQFADQVAGSWGTLPVNALQVWTGFGATISSAELSITFTETFTFDTTPDTILHLRRSATHTVGGNYWDAIPTLGSSASTTAVTNTAAGGTEVQLTRTAGGTVLEWITPRFKYPFSFEQYDDTLPPVLGKFYMHESNAAANCGIYFKIFRRNSLGVETLVYTSTTSSSEMATVAGTGYTLNTLTGTYSFTPVSIYADDRFVIRVYLVPLGGTMAGGFTATLTYDHNVNAGVGDSFVTLYNVPDFKLETDPNTPATIPDGTSTLGIGN